MRFSSCKDGQNMDNLYNCSTLWILLLHVQNCEVGSGSWFTDVKSQLPSTVTNHLTRHEYYFTVPQSRFLTHRWKASGSYLGELITLIQLEYFYFIVPQSRLLTHRWKVSCLREPITVIHYVFYYLIVS